MLHIFIPKLSRFPICQQAWFASCRHSDRRTSNKWRENENRALGEIKNVSIEAEKNSQIAAEMLNCNKINHLECEQTQENAFRL